VKAPAKTAKAAATDCPPDPYATPPRRGRPRQYDPAEALQRVRDVFWVKGYAATSLDDLVEATGMNRPSLYAAFGDKQALYIAALSMMANNLVNAVRAGVELDVKLKPFVELFFTRCMDSYLLGGAGPRGCFLVGTALTEAVVSEDVRNIVRNAFGRCEELLEGRLRQAKAAGELPANVDPRALAMMISSTMHELAMQARAGTPRPAMAERAKLIAKLIGVSNPQIS
jgi:AcrR family transcriptional regulator